MAEILFRNRRDEKVEVNVVFENGAKKNFGLDVDEESPIKCNEGEVVTWGWYPWQGSGGGNPDPDCPAQADEVVDIVEDCRMEANVSA